ncbi:FBN1-like protein [Mya arenaria]|uniref:FBN1-like protein n=1 Tax=Mya arenaria TaxID=6604 RepID=A0ABY7DNU6_MYAAR|nr:FBN1-like protein [Mya arenaria]
MCNNTGVYDNYTRTCDVSQLPQTVEEGAIDVDLCMAHGQELCIETMTVELQLCPQNVYAFLATDLWDCPSAYCVATEIESSCSTDTDCAQIQGSHCVNNICMCNNTGSCCYDSKSQQWTNEIGRAGGYYTYHPKTHPKEHTLNDQIPKDICCIKSNLCNLYYELRPPGECYKKVPFDIAASWGDPHFLTLDGKQFIFNGLGEYILLDMKNGDVAVTLQARTERAVRKNGELSEATVFVAFAAFDSFNASFHVEVNNDKDGIIIYGNGIDLTNLYKRSDSSNNAFEYDGKNEGLSILKLRKSKERKQNENKTDVEETVELSFHRSNVTFQITPTNGLLALRTMVSNQYRNKTRGLLGNFDEISENDFITPNDEILSPNMTERDIFYYGEIHENNSAFFYQDQTSHNDFQNASFVPRFLDEADPKLAEPFPRFIVTTADGGKSQVISVPIVLCSGCSGHGECASETDLREDQSSLFQYLRCQCYPQYEDINECELVNGCEQICINTDGSYICDCDKGFRISYDLQKCLDINECDESLHNCSHLCENIRGGFKCVCHSGYMFEVSSWGCIADSAVTLSCTDIDCSQAEGCTVNSVNESTCFCLDGYVFDRDTNTCVDIDECTIGVCPHDCVNHNGSFQCKCHRGYKLTDVTKCTECDAPFYGDDCGNMCDCSPNGMDRCDPGKGCICRVGWHGPKCEDDVNECENVISSCAEPYTECGNTIGSFICKCIDGYEKSSDSLCVDTDECADPLQNNCSHVCLNTAGGYTCECDEGYTDDGIHCKDIDECELGTSGCDQLCENHQGAFNCYCYFGYRLNDDRQTCKEDDDLNTCSDKTSCKNVPGSFLCDCQVGSKLENDGRTCTACDEFHFGKNCSESCHCVNGECDSITGCKCFPGWRGVDCIIDLDECSMANNCTGETVCSNTAGSYACACKSGFKLEEDICHDINECADNSLNTCDQICNNTNGSYDCECYEGYIFDGSMRKCKAKQLCEDEDHCPENSTCVIENKNASCVCNKGFQSSSNTNVTCSDIDECLMEPSLCSQQCHNVKGSFYCFCDTGYRLQQDARTCTACEEGYYGENCNTKCQCVSENTDTCDGTTGECRCLQEWDGDACDMDVNECNTSLNICPLRSQCKNLQGGFLCECDIGFEMTADRQCKECDVNYFGKNCASLCGCREDDTQLSCDNIGGQCLCKPGYGLSLEGNIRCSMCTYNTYGVNCSETCPCNLTNSQQMQQSCDPVVGTCMCNKMWEGSTCNQDLDECSTPNICGTSDDKGCHNIKGGYVCDCRRGYHMVNNSCVKERVFLFTHEIIIYVALPTSEDLEVIATYNEVEQNVKDSLYTFHSEFTDANITIFIHDIRRGSLLVNYTVALETREENGDQARADLVAAFVALGNNATIVYDGQNVSTFSDYASDICEVYENAFGKCEADLECVVENGLPECRQTERAATTEAAETTATEITEAAETTAAAESAKTTTL